jgi:hypothetical protein
MDTADYADDTDEEGDGAVKGASSLLVFIRDIRAIRG